jgi:hypothetical protein
MVRIVKKKTTLFNRFESDKHVRMGVRIALTFREAGENPEVLIAE